VIWCNLKNGASMPALRRACIAAMALLAAIAVTPSTALGGPPLPYPTIAVPGTPAEQALITGAGGTTVASGARQAEQGQSWTYSFAAAPGDRCRLDIVLTDPAASPPELVVLGADNKPIASKSSADATEKATLTTVWTMPQSWPLGSHVPVTITAKAGPVAINLVRFSVAPQDLNGDGFPEYLARLMLQGLPPNARIAVSRPPSRPYTVFQSGHLPDPQLDVQTDAVFAYTSAIEPIQGWKQRGYTVWTMGGMRDGKEYLAQHPGEAQTDAAGHPITAGDSIYFTPTANRIAAERAYYETALANGSDGICPEEPEYFARAGYEPAFRAAWEQMLKSPWLDPAGSISARWQASRLMAQLETDQVSQLLQPVADAHPAARRMVAIHSPLHYALAGIVSPQYAITSLPAVQDVIGQVWTGTARTPVRYIGLRQDWTSSLAYLEYSSLYQLLRGTGRRLWFLTDPLEDDPTRTPADYKSHYEQTLIASLLFPEVDSYEVMPWPERIFGHIAPDYATEIDTVVAALQDMHNQPAGAGNAVSAANVGVLVSDSMQWQREPPSPSDLDGLSGLAMPLLQRGVPVQVVSLDRAADPGYLRPFKALLLSYDYQKPLGTRVQAAIAQWVRDGGCLLFAGGSDAYNALPDSWWRQAKLDAPQLDLWNQLGVGVRGSVDTVSAPAEDTSRYKQVLAGDGGEHDLKNRRVVTLDLTPYAQSTGSVAVRFTDVTPNDGWGAFLAGAKLEIGAQLAAQFLAGSDLESRFLVYDSGSQYNGTGRFADGTSSWTYEFDNLPANSPIKLSLDIGNGFAVSVAPVKPAFGHTLLSTPAAGVVATAFPRLRIPAAYPASLYPQIQPAPVDKDRNAKPASGPDVLYTLRSGGAPVWSQAVGKGLVINVGVAPGFFSANERSAGLLRALVRYGVRRVGGSVKEADALRLKRGKYTIVRTFDDSETIEGRTIDLLSPTLPAAEDREVPSHSVALLYDIGPGDDPPHIGFVSGRVQAKVETNTATAFYVRGPLGTTGAARLHCGSRKLSGARAIDRLGHPVNVQADPDGGTVLLRYPNDPDGVLVRVGWE
jgi:hypothetical protein